MKAKNEGYMTSRRERLGYWSYFAGQSMSYVTVGTFLTAYLMLNGLDLAKIAGAMLAVKVWDAVNDTLFGMIFDRVRFKSGHKCLPWLRITNVVIPVTTVLIFLIPGGLSPNAKLLWFVVSYILWDASYTLSDVPIYGMVTMMTSSLSERNGLLSIARITALAGAFLISAVGTVLVSEKVGMSFSAVALIAAALIALTMLPVCLRGKERIKTQHVSEEAYSFKSMLRYLKTNKYLLLFYLGYIVFGVLSGAGALSLFVSYYLFGSALFGTVLLALASLPMVVLSLFINRILKKVDKFKLFFYCNLAYALVGTVVYFVGYQNVAAYIALALVSSIPLGFIYILNLTFTPDCVEYGQYKTGIDARGIAFAVQSFAAKFAAVGQPVALFLLGLFGWTSIEASSFAELEAMNVVQSAQALKGLWFTGTLVPALGAALALIPYFFYKLNDKDVQTMAKYNAGEISLEEAETQLTRSY